MSICNPDCTVYGVEAITLILVSRVGRRLRHLCPGFLGLEEVFFLDALIDFFPENKGRNGGLYAQSYLLAPDLKDRDADVIPDK